MLILRSNFELIPDQPGLHSEISGLSRGLLVLRSQQLMGYHSWASVCVRRTSKRKLNLPHMPCVLLCHPWFSGDEYEEELELFLGSVRRSMVPRAGRKPLAKPVDENKRGPAHRAELMHHLRSSAVSNKA